MSQEGKNKYTKGRKMWISTHFVDFFWSFVGISYDLLSNESNGIQKLS
jgi:hypothetical protein